MPRAGKRWKKHKKQKKHNTLPNRSVNVGWLNSLGVLPSRALLPPLPVLDRSFGVFFNKSSRVEPPDAPFLLILYISSMLRKEFTCFEDQSQNLHSPFVAEVVGSFSSFFSVFFSRVVDTKRIQELICRRFDLEQILRCCITPQVRTLQGCPEMIMTNL